GNHPLDALEALEWLQEGKLAAVQMDRPTPSGTLITRLFGHPFAVPRGPFVLASLARVPLLPVFASRRGFFDYQIEVGHAIELPSRADGRQMQQAAESFATQLAAF